MGKRSDLTVPQRREVVLMLLRREEPAAKLARQILAVVNDLFHHLKQKPITQRPSSNGHLTHTQNTPIARR